MTTTWAAPQAFWLFLPLAALVLLLFFKRRPKAGRLLYSDLSLLKNLPRSFKVRGRFLPSVFKIAAAALLIAALARPQTPAGSRPQTAFGIDILLALDISLSMLVMDMEERDAKTGKRKRTSRLQAAKRVMRDFIKGRSSDRIGILVFSGEAYTLAPLTSDHDFLLNRLEKVSAADEIKPGTAIGVALALSAARMRHAPFADSRALIFLTDGENTAGFINPLTGLEFLKKEKVKVWTIGVGSLTGKTAVKVPPSAPGAPSVIRYIETHINKDLLRKIAKETGGKFFDVQNLRSLKNVFKEIDSLEKRELPENTETPHKELFVYPLLAAFAAYGFALLLSLTVFFRGV